MKIFDTKNLKMIKFSKNPHKSSGLPGFCHLPGGNHPQRARRQMAPLRLPGQLPLHRLPAEKGD